MEETPQGPSGEEPGQPSQPEEAQPETGPTPPPAQEPPVPEPAAAEYVPPPPPAAPAEAPPKKSNRKWWFIGCGCLLLLCILASVGAAFLGFGGMKLFQSITAPVGPIKAQLAAVDSGDLSKAYNDYTSKGFRDATSFDQFKQIVDANPQIFKSKSSSFNNVKIENGQAVVKGTITGQDGTVTNMQYKLVLENGQWKIQSFQEQ